MSNDILVQEVRLLRQEVVGLRTDISRFNGRQPLGGGGVIATATPDLLPPGRWYNTAQASAIIGCNRVTLRRWCRRHMTWCSICNKHHDKPWCEVRKAGGSAPLEGHARQTLPGVRFVETDKGTRYEVHELIVEQWRIRHEEYMRSRNGNGHHHGGEE